MAGRVGVLFLAAACLTGFGDPGPAGVTLWGPEARTDCHPDTAAWSRLAQQIHAETNVLRRDPAAYAEHLERMLPRFEGRVLSGRAAPISGPTKAPARCARRRTRILRLLAGIADQTSLALTARPTGTRSSSCSSTVAVLANALEATDEYTSSHARWISDAALAVGERLGLDAGRMRSLEYGALLHDIGKLGIPQEILAKPGPLTAEERLIVEQHPVIGERILAPVERLADVARIVRACHERWDGGGYPDGTAGAEIPLEARIVFVCDAFHAMVTDRPYRGALSTEEAYDRLRAGAGTQFDPEVVEMFLALELPPVDR